MSVGIIFSDASYDVAMLESKVQLNWGEIMCLESKAWARCLIGTS